MEKPDLVTVGLSSLYPIGILTVWKAEFASVTPSTLVLAAPEHQAGLTADISSDDIYPQY